MFQLRWYTIKQPVELQWTTLSEVTHKKGGYLVVTFLANVDSYLGDRSQLKRLKSLKVQLQSMSFRKGTVWQILCCFVMRFDLLTFSKFTKDMAKKNFLKKGENRSKNENLLKCMICLDDNKRFLLMWKFASNGNYCVLHVLLCSCLRFCYKPGTNFSNI